MENVHIEINGGNVSDYYYLADLLKKINVRTEIKEQESTGEELGCCFQDLIILLPLATPVIAELRQMLDSYLSYLSVKNANKQVKLMLQKGSKKLELESESGRLPDVEDYYGFFE
ncbi:MAG: hypothetical protein FWE08_04515 [Oscillospiraceae bacterium]|nr:hypothetical protein [Oscillospiraceae bacterium]